MARVDQPADFQAEQAVPEVAAEGSQGAQDSRVAAVSRADREVEVAKADSADLAAASQEVREVEAAKADSAADFPAGLAADSQAVPGAWVADLPHRRQSSRTFG